MAVVLSFDLGFRHLSYCLMDFTRGMVPEILCWKTVPVTDKPKPTAADIVDAATDWIAKNDFVYLAPDIVVFETQMKTNPKMVKMAAAMHGAIRALASSVGNTVKFAYVKPALKFTYFIQVDPNDRAPAATKAQKYRWRKQVAVNLCREFLQLWSAHEDLEYFNETACNFDMADSLTNACAYAKLTRLPFN